MSGPQRKQNLTACLHSVCPIITWGRYLYYIQSTFLVGLADGGSLLRAKASSTQSQSGLEDRLTWHEMITTWMRKYMYVSTPDQGEVETEMQTNK